MDLNRLSFLIFLIPIVIGVKTTASKVETAVNNKDNVTLTHATLPEVVNNSVGDLSIMTEGGFIGEKQTIATAAKSTTLPTKIQPNQELKSDIKGTTLLTKTQPNQEIKSDIKGTTLIKTQSDPLPDIPTRNTGTSVVARKGVNFKEEDSAKENKSVNAADPAKASEANTKTELTNKATTNTAHVQPKKHKSNTSVPHKPTRLISAALENSGDKTFSLIEEGLKHKQATNPGSHPGMIMPIVITILVVPLFAVLGYMALKRGQEAWKNRHYKRMDFLLDGMYND